MSRGRIALAVLGAIALLLVAAQLFLPGYAADKIESRMTRNGGEASATVKAVPAVRLVFGDGDRVSARAIGVRLDLSRRERPFRKLDGFSEVDIGVTTSHIGPLAIDRMTLTRDGSGPYRFTWNGSVSLADIAGFGAGQLGALGAVAGPLAAGSLPNASKRLPIDLDMAIKSEDGRVRVVSGGGTFAGVPTGPLAELLTAAIAVSF
jgi:hypothetical protein